MEYQEAAKKNRIQGKVYLSFHVNKDKQAVNAGSPKFINFALEDDESIGKTKAVV